MIRPTREQLGLLKGFERTAFAIADTVNRHEPLKRAAHGFLSSVGRTWVHVSTYNLVHTEGLEHMTSLRPDRGVFLVSNHRSMFDMYATSSVLLRHTDWIRRMYFPVRSTFFYERPLGVFVNMVMSMWAMYPPILRDSSRRGFNQYGIDYITDEIKRPGTLVGFHPEGTRGKSDDPYTLLPANVGAGTIIHQARPIVMPMFTLGLLNSLPRQVASNFDGTGEPVTMVFGPPLDLSSFYDMPPGVETYKALAERVHEEITRLGQQERAMRERLGLPRKGRGLRGDDTRGDRVRP